MNNHFQRTENPLVESMTSIQLDDLITDSIKCIKRLNNHFREGVLDAYLFDNLEQVNRLAEDWREDYNQNKSLGSKNPWQVLSKFCGASPAELGS